MERPPRSLARTERGTGAQGRRSGRALSPWPRRATQAVVVLSLANAAAQVVRAVNGAASTDFLAFVTGARLSGRDAACLYCPGAQAATQAAITGGHGSGLNAFVNLPAVAVVMRPLAALPLRAGLSIFLALSLAGLAVSAMEMRRWLPAAMDPRLRAALIVGPILSLSCGQGLALGQLDAVLLPFLAGAVGLLARGRRPLLAGMLLSVLVAKPQLVLMVGPALVAAGAWGALAGLGLGAAGWLASSLALVGPHGLAAWWRLVGQSSPQVLSKSLPGIVQDMTGRPAGAFVAAALLSLVGLAVLCWARGRLRGHPAEAAGLGVALSLAVAPHLLPGDLLLACVPLVLRGATRLRSSLVFVAGLDVANVYDFQHAHGQLQAALTGVLAVLLIADLCGGRPRGVKDGQRFGDRGPAIACHS
jgi:hypothetical protein